MPNVKVQTLILTVSEILYLEINYEETIMYMNKYMNIHCGINKFVTN